uniref:CCDC81 HU domain-containing protein n=1 Tax=Trichobilharzia regenti TaxID=157069 RepID=A0AA85JDJ7_TRIRE|nr:unnamed protein product [Trichobilharzia regenti]
MLDECQPLVFIRDQEIWQHVCTYLKKKLLTLKSVRFSNIGTFGFTHRELMLTNGVYINVQKPVFVLSEKICQSHEIIQRRHIIEGSIPLILLNYSELSAEISLPREQIEECIQNVYTMLNQCLHHDKFVEIVFNDIGKLRINKRKAKFCFFNNFLIELDSSGKLAQTYCNRPESSDCMTTDRSGLSNRSYKSIKSLQQLATIDENETTPSCTPILNENRQLSRRQGSQMSSESKSSKRDVHEHFQDDNDSLASCIHTSRIYKNNQVAQIHDIVESGTQCNSDTEESISEKRLNLKPQMSDPPAEVTSVREIFSNNFIRPELPKLDISDTEHCTKENSKSVSHCSTPKISSKMSSYSRSSLSSVRSMKSSNIEELERRIPKIDENCNHALNTNNGLCYLCHQRRIRNIPVDMKDEIRQREQAEEELLRMYQAMRADNEVKKEQENLLNRRSELCKQAAYNMGIACAKQLKKSYVDPTNYETFILNKRPSTPLRQIKQNELKSELDHQVEKHLSDVNRLKEKELYLDKLEHSKLTEELKNHKKQMYQNKLLNQSAYKEALDFQVKCKPEHIPKSVNNSLGMMFKMFEENDKKLVERSHIAKSIQKHQLKSIEESKNQMKNEQLYEKEQEEKVLKRVHDDLVTEKLQQRQEQKAMRQYLENEWLKAAQLKHDKELHEKLRDQSYQGLLLLEQTDKYKRCNQCRRRLDNIGQSNMTTDTYIRGKHFIV